MNKKRILVISSKPPFPVQNGAAIRTMQMLRMLSVFYDIDLIYPYTGQDSRDGLDKWCKNIYAFRTSVLGMVSRGILGLFISKPLQCSYFYSSKVNGYVKNNMHKYHLAFCNNIRTAQYVIDIPCYKIIDYVDAISMNYWGAIKNANLFWKYINKIEYKRLACYEKRVLMAFDKHIIISSVDKNFIKSGAAENSKEIFVIGNSVPFDEELITQNEESNLVFVGSMCYAPNIVAVKTFVKSIFPLVLNRIPNAKFYIVGSRPVKSICDLASENIIVTGFVDDPKDYLRKATVVVVPMYSGAGVQNKILEAMSIGCCVVTTKIGSEGLECISDGQELFIRSEYNEMADTIVDLIDDKQQRERVGKAAKKYINNFLTFNIIFDRFKSILYS